MHTELWCTCHSHWDILHATLVFSLVLYIFLSRVHVTTPYGCCLVCRGCGCQSYTYLN